MKTFKRSVIYIAVFFLLVIFIVPVAVLAQEESDWNIYFHPGIRFGTDDRVIGFYDVMVPVYLTDTSMLFVNPRFSHDSTHGHEWNLGGGYRQILWDNQLMLGLNAYYDLKKDGRSGYWFDQWGMGFEAMGEFDSVMTAGGGLGLTGRFNFYVPLSGSKTEGGVGVGGGGYTFQNLGIFGEGGGVVYEPLTGLDYEMGMRIPYLSEYVETWAYAGGYHYWGKESGNMDGFCGRIEVIPTDFVALDFEYRNDNWYGDEFYGEVKVEVPFSIGNLVEGKNPFEGLGGRFGGSRTLSERMSEPVRRDIDIKIETVETGDPTTTTGGLIEEVVFVSEGGEADPLADGTFEHPYGTIGDAMADPRIGVTAFTIHVIDDNGGDGVVYTGIGGTVNLPGLLLWGSGVGHPLYGTVCGMSCGYPDMSDGFVVNGDDIEVLGLRFCGGTGLQIQGGTGITVHNNEFIGPGSDHGLYVTSPADLLSVSDNLFQNWEYGMYITGGTGTSISRNYITDCTTGIRSNGGSDISIIGNSIGVTNFGIELRQPLDVDLLTSITGNTIVVDNTGIAGGGAYGIYLRTTGTGDIDATVIGNSLFVTDNDDGGSASGINIDANDTGIVYPTIRDNYMELSAYDPDPAISPIFSGGIMIWGDGGVGGPGPGEAVAILGNTISMVADGSVSGINVQARGPFDLYASGAGYGVRDNTITGRAYDYACSSGGISIGHAETGDVYVDVTGNSIDLNHWDPVASTGGYTAGITVYGDYTLFGTVSNNPLIRLEGYGTSRGIDIHSESDIGSVTNPFTIVDNPSITAINHSPTVADVFGIALYSSFPGRNVFARITGNTDIDLLGLGTIYGIDIDARNGLIGDSSASFATLISGNGFTFNSGTGITNYGIYLNKGWSGTTNWVDLGAGTPGSVGSNSFTLLGGGATWSGNYAGNVIYHDFTMPTDRIDP